MNNPLCIHCGEQIEPTGGKLYLWTHVDPNQQKCIVAKPAELGDGEPSPSPSKIAALIVEAICLLVRDCECKFCLHECIECENCPECQIAMREAANDVLMANLRSGAAQEVSPPATGTTSDPRTGYLKQEVSPPSPEPLCPMCCKPAIMPVPPSELEVRELKAALAKFVQNGKIRIKQLETMKEFGLCQAGELAVWRVVCDDLEKLLG